MEVGDAILEAAKSVDLRGVAARFKAFDQSHKSFSKLEAAVRKAEQKLREQQQRSGEADAAQDADVDAIASALVGDGYSRTSPFKVLGFPSPSKVQDLGHAEEAKVILRLAAAVRRRKDVSKDTLAVVARAEKSAKAVQAALKPIAALEKAMKDALRARDAVAQDWEYRFAGLKLAAKLAAADGDSRILDALFTQPGGGSPSKKKAKKKPVAGSGTEPV